MELTIWKKNNMKEKTKSRKSGRMTTLECVTFADKETCYVSNKEKKAMRPFEIGKKVLNIVPFALFRMDYDYSNFGILRSFDL